MTNYYKMRKGKIVSGVLAGLADKYQMDPTLARVLFAIFLFATPGGVALFLYILLSVILSYKEDLIEHDEVTYSDGRRRKNAQAVEEDDWTW
nr:PspC domain-containing protein [Streptococcus sp. 19428wA2_WM07]